MVKDLDKFYNSIDILDKAMTIYEDEDGNYSVLPTSSLLVAVDYNEFEPEQYKIAIFNGDIPKDFKAETKTIKKPIPKIQKTNIL